MILNKRFFYYIWWLRDCVVYLGIIDRQMANSTKNACMTIAQQLRIKEFPFMIRDSRGNCIYWEDSDGSWHKREYDAEGNLVRYENSDGHWSKREYDTQGNLIRYKISSGYWEKREYDAQGNTIYYEDSRGNIRDRRPKTDKFVEVTIDELAVKLNISVEVLKIMLKH